MQFNVLLVGATGALGSIFAHTALQAGHKLTLYVRSPQKLSEDLSSHPNVRVIVGQLIDGDKLREAVATGVDSVVLLIGGDSSTRGAPILDGLKTLYPILIAEGVKRVIIIATPSYVDPADKTTWTLWFLTGLVSYIAPGAWRQVIGMAKYTKEQAIDQLEWTVPRITFLTNGESKPVYAGYVGDGRSGLAVTRRSVADWCLTELFAKKWVGKAPVLSNL